MQSAVRDVIPVTAEAERETNSINSRWVVFLGGSEAERRRQMRGGTV